MNKSINQLLKLLESKDHLIDKLNLTDEQKTELKVFFQAHPNFENKIDWNRKDLTYNDFIEILKLEGNTKSSKKKYGLSGKAQIEDLVEGQDYLIALQATTYTVYYPLTFKASEVLAKPTTPPLGITGRWCIAGKNYSPGTRDQHWNQYTDEGNRGDFFFIFTSRTKYALYRPDWIDEADWTSMRLFNCKDQELPIIRLPSKTLSENLLKKLARYPRKLKQKWLDEKKGNCDEVGVEYSKDKKTLVSAEVMKSFPVESLTYQIPDTVEVIQEKAFQGCEMIKEVSLPAALNDWGMESFSNSGLKTVVFPKNFIYNRIPRDTFRFCYYLENLQYNNRPFTLPKSVKMIGPGAFYGCRSLKQINFPKELTIIRDAAFHSCTSLKEIDLSKTNLSMLEPLAFYGCKSLETIRLPMSIFKGISGGVHPNTFMFCDSLKNVYLYGELPQGQTTQSMEEVAKSIISHWLANGLRQMDTSKLNIHFVPTDR